MTIRQGTNIIAGANLDVSSKANISLNNITAEAKALIINATRNTEAFNFIYAEGSK